MTELIQQFGALGVFVLMVPEAACVPVPSEVTLLFAGFAVDQGWMSPWLAVLAATAGNIVGSLLAYGIGATGRLDRIPGARTVLLRWQGMLDRHGDRAVLLARLLPLARTFVSLPAGARRVALPRFVLLTAVGSAVWAAGLVLAGMLASGAWQAVSSVLGHVLLAAGLLTIAATLFRRRPRS